MMFADVGEKYESRLGELGKFNPFKHISIKHFMKYVYRPVGAFVIGAVTTPLQLIGIKSKVFTKAFRIKGHESMEFFRAGRLAEIVAAVIVAGVVLGPAAWAAIAPHLMTMLTVGSTLMGTFSKFFMSKGQSQQQADNSAMALYNGQMPVPPGLAGQFGPDGGAQIVNAGGAQLPTWQPGQKYAPGQAIPDGFALNFDAGTVVGPDGTHYDMGTGNPIDLGLASNELAAGTGPSKGGLKNVAANTQQASMFGGGTVPMIALGVIGLAIVGMAFKSKE